MNKLILGLIILIVVAIPFASAQACDTSNFHNGRNFLIKNGGENVAGISIQGNWKFKGSINEFYSGVVPAGSFNIKDRNGNFLASIDKSGNLYLKSQLIQNQGLITGTVGQDLIIRAGPNILAVFDSFGNLRVQGCVQSGVTV